MFHLRRFVVISTRQIVENNLKTPYLVRKNLSTHLPETSSSSKPLVLTDSCIKRLKELKASNSKRRLRVLVDSGGCSGFEYKFSLDTDAKPDDLIVEKDGCEILVDQASVPYLEGATVDYYEELIRTGFRIVNNPKSEQGCSCGTSFSIKI